MYSKEIISIISEKTLHNAVWNIVTDIDDFL